MDKNVELVKEFYAAVSRNDIPAAIGMMAEDVEIYLPGPPEIPFAGTFRGHEGAGRFFQAIGATAVVRALEATEFIAQDDQVVALGHEALTARVTGRSWETGWAMVWTIQDGRVARLREFHQTDAIASAYR